MKFQDLMNAERRGLEESAEPDRPVEIQGSDSKDDMFCTAAGAASIKPSAGRSSGKLRELFNSVDRA